MGGSAHSGTRLSGPWLSPLSWARGKPGPLDGKAGTKLGSAHSWLGVSLVPSLLTLIKAIENRVRSHQWGN